MYILCRVVVGMCEELSGRRWLMLRPSVREVLHHLSVCIVSDIKPAMIREEVRINMERERYMSI